MRSALPAAVRPSKRTGALGLAVLAVVAVAGVSVLPAHAVEAAPADEHLVVSTVNNVATASAISLTRINGNGGSDGAAWALPTAVSGANKAVTLEGNSGAVGALARSTDGRYVTLAGYTAAPGATFTTVPRVVARVDGTGAVDSSTTLGTSFTSEKIRGAVTDDGSRFWVTGHGNTATPKGGVTYSALGGTTPAVLVNNSGSGANAAFNNTRVAQIADGNLYFSSEKGTPGIFRVGASGLPTSGTQTATSVVPVGADGAGATSFFFLDRDATVAGSDTLYVSTETVGVQKFSFNGTSWTNRGTIAGTSGYFGITGGLDGSTVRLYGINGSAAANTVTRLVDTAAFNVAPAVAAPTTISTASAGTSFRGIAFTPDAPSSGLTAPDAPTAVTGTAGDGSVALSWTAPVSNGGSAITGYTVTPYIGATAQTPVVLTGTATTTTVSGLTNGTAYTFKVAATNAIGTGAQSASSAAVTPTSAPGVVSLALGSNATLAGAIGDTTNPTVAVTVGQAGATPADVTVTATATTKSAVARTVDVTVTGTGATRTLSVAPQGVGYADLTIRASGLGGQSATTVLHYAASAASATPSTSRYLTGSSDASTAIDVGDGYALVADDETNTLKLYSRTVSGAPVSTWNFSSSMGNPEEIDMEGSSRVGNTIYWTGSMGNSKSGNLKPDRSILYTTTITGSGATTQLAFGGYYRGLRADLISWDQSHGNQFGFAAGAAAGNVPKQIDGFNAEALEFAPGSTTTAYVGFRAPLTPPNASGDALVVPVTNLPSLVGGSPNTSVHATFGTPIVMDLNGLSIREIRKNAADEYLISAGSWSAENNDGDAALYSWDGVAAHTPVLLRALPSTDPGAYESIVDVPSPLASGGTTQLIADNGASDLYADGLEAKDLARAEWKKARADVFTLPATVFAPGAPTAVTGTAGDGAVALSWTAPASNGGSAITGYTVTPYVGAVAQTPVVLTGTGTTTTVSGLTNGTAYTFKVAATNAIGSSAQSAASAPVTPVVPATAPGAPSDVAGASGDSSVFLSWVAPAVDGGSAITGYTVTPYVGATAQAPIVLTGTATTSTVGGLTNGTAYTFTVRAINAVGTGAASVASAAVTPLGLPDAPTGVTAVPGDGAVDLAWTAPADDGGSSITGYTVNVYAADVLQSSSQVAADPASVTVTGLVNGTAYTFGVVATTTVGDGTESVRSTSVVPVAVVPPSTDPLLMYSDATGAQAALMQQLAATMVDGDGDALIEYHQAKPPGVTDTTHADRPLCTFVTPQTDAAFGALAAAEDGLPFGGSADFSGCVDLVATGSDLQP